MSRLARTGRRLGAVDGWLLRQALKSRSPTNDRVLQTTGQAANRSRLWFAVAGVLALAGGSRGRRAAARGLLGIGISSAVVNGPMKYVWRRQRPAAELLGLQPSLISMPRSFSFPSGHSASAFAFATGVAREWPVAGAPVGAAAALVAYSRVHTGVHFPGDVLAGTALGVGAGLLAGKLLRDDPGIALPPATGAPIPTRAVLVASPGSGAAEQLDAARAELRAQGIEIVDELEVDDAHKLADVVALPADDRPLVIAAGGDGTVGACADELAGTGVVLGILPLGTSNDVARSLGISPDPVRAAAGLRSGVVRAIDTGQVTVSGRSPRAFVHAATVGLNVHFAELATKSSLRRRFGRFTYAVAAVRALRQHEPFECELRYDGTTEKLTPHPAVDHQRAGVRRCARPPRARRPDGRPQPGRHRDRAGLADPPAARHPGHRDRPAPRGAGRPRAADQAAAGARRAPGRRGARRRDQQHAAGRLRRRRRRAARRDTADEGRRGALTARRALQTGEGERLPHERALAARHLGEQARVEDVGRREPGQLERVLLRLAVAVDRHHVGE